MKSLNTYLAGLLVVFLAGCATQTTSSVLHEPDMVPLINNVAVAPLSVNSVDKLLFENVEHILPTVLVQGLKTKQVFNIIGPDSLETLTRATANHEETQLMSAARDAGLDAVLFAEIAYEQNRIPGLNPLDARVTLRLVHADYNTPVLTSTFDTAASIKYEDSVTPKQVTFDATLGALKPIIRMWQVK